MSRLVDLDSDLKEYHDTDIDAKIKSLAALVASSKHCIVFTGAGISTSASIPDYRGPNGAWVCKEKGLAPPTSIGMTQALPTSCHMALQDLQQRGVIKYIVSQNVDGLHRRSGVPANGISELHGNTYKEICWNCESTENLRTHEVQERINGDGGLCHSCSARVPHFCHCTSRKCATCNCHLKDSIIHFGEQLPVEALERAFANAEAADLCIVLGSSLTVTPASDIPRIVGQKTGANLVIVNLQKTDMDDLAALRIHGKTDRVMEGVMAALGFDVPLFTGDVISISNSSAGETKENVQVLSAEAAAANAAIVQVASRGRNGGFGVWVKEDCEHASTCKSCDANTVWESLWQESSDGIDGRACQECGDVEESWLCGGCHTVLCGRHVNKHMLQHSKAENHPVAVSLSDLSVWCFECDSYISQSTNAAVLSMFRKLHELKCGEPAPL